MIHGCQAPRSDSSGPQSDLKKKKKKKNLSGRREGADWGLTLQDYSLTLIITIYIYIICREGGGGGDGWGQDRERERELEKFIFQEL